MSSRKEKALHNGSDNRNDRTLEARKRLASMTGPPITFKRPRQSTTTSETTATFNSSTTKQSTNTTRTANIKKTTTATAATTTTTSINPLSSPYGRCANVSERYKKVSRIGEGTYGIVYKAIDQEASTQDHQQIVALKRCLPHHEASDGFPITTLREIQILKEISLDVNVNVNVGNGTRTGHENIIALKEVAVGSKSSSIFLVFEYVHFDLAKLIDDHYSKYSKSPFTMAETKCLSKQLFSALSYLHEKNIIHRDLKLSNLLYDKNRGLLKLADFGLARKMEGSLSLYDVQDGGDSGGGVRRSDDDDNDVGDNDADGDVGDNDADDNDDNNKIIHISNKQKQHHYHHALPNSPTNTTNLTPKVVSLWYRPPELLLNATSYSMAIDQWAAGCVIAELLLGKPLFRGKNDLDQLAKIVEVLGSPTLLDWPAMVDLPLVFSNVDLPFDLDLTEAKHENDTPLHLEAGQGQGQGSIPPPGTGTGAGAIPPAKRRKMMDIFPDLSPLGFELFQNLLLYDPERRWSARKAHGSAWFEEHPMAVKKDVMPTFDCKL